MRIVVFRILGNDIPPRHDPNQTVENTKFILKNECTPVGVQKHFVLNRLVGAGKGIILREMIESAGYPCHVIPFVPNEYRALVPQDRARYICNVNNARNVCIDYGLRVCDADWVFPLDGGTYLREEDWNAVDVSMSEHPGAGFVGIHTWRASSYEEALVKEMSPEDRFEDYYPLNGPPRRGMRELSLGFSQHSDAVFSETLTYGQVDKAELLWRLGIEGEWDRWEPQIKRKVMHMKSKFFGKVPIGGFVCRLPAGKNAAEGNNLIRGMARNRGVQRLVAETNRIVGVQ